jgi:hypothetical protein
MRLGLGIVLLLIGAVLAFAVKDNVSGVNLTMVGYICMGVGALALILSLITQAQATNTSHKTTVERNDNPPTV